MTFAWGAQWWMPWFTDCITCGSLPYFQQILPLLSTFCLSAFRGSGPRVSLIWWDHSSRRIVSHKTPFKQATRGMDLSSLVGYQPARIYSFGKCLVPVLHSLLRLMPLPLIYAPGETTMQASHVWRNSTGGTIAVECIWLAVCSNKCNLDVSVWSMRFCRFHFKCSAVMLKGQLHWCVIRLPAL